jgi:hypothetical protein
MASIINLIRGTDREYFDLFERAGANVARAGELLTRSSQVSLTVGRYCGTGQIASIGSSLGDP